MVMRKILFPVDFSERCSAAGRQVAAHAEHFQARLTVLNVLEIPPIWYSDLASAELESLVNIEELKAERRSKLAAFVHSEFERLPRTETAVEQGDPATVITALARAQGVDLIMMPTHGYGPFRRLLLGSVTAKVLHDAECPVWTDVHVGVPFAKIGCRLVLCAVDLTEESVPAMRWAAGFAASYGAELGLVHAIPALAGPATPGDASFRKYLIDTAQEQIAQLQQKAGSSARVSIEGGRIADAVCKTALERQADLVVIGQGRMHEALGRLRTNAYAIVRESPCPVVRV